jgi:ATP-dependent helicase/nuclease subunit A
MAAAAGQRLTAQQQRALEARGVSVALSAGAGCGKTTVLTEKFLRALEPDPSGDETDAASRLDQLTAITFTERAAREMRDRIRKGCLQRLRDAPEHEVPQWLRLVRQLDTARISTIHSFCGSLLRAHAVEAGVDPRFQVLDQPQGDTLLYEQIDRQLRRGLAEGDEAVLDLVVQFSLAGLRDMVRRLLAERQEIDWPQWRHETVEGLLARWERYWREEALPRAAQRVARSAQAAEILRILRDHFPAHPVMGPRAAALRDQLTTLGATAGLSSSVSCTAGQASSGTWRAGGSGDARAALAALRENAKVQGGGGKAAWSSEEVYGRFRDAAQGLRKGIDEVQNRVAFDPEAARGSAASALRLLAVADGVAAAYEAEKRAAAALDFTDLLIRARDLLTGPHGDDLRKRLAAQTKLLLVDEFQDTDPLQVEVVKALCDGRFTAGKLFLVGDKKQSIYRFRGADPGVFQQLRREIPGEGRLPLSENFRSQPAVLEFINALFAEELQEADEPYEPLRAVHHQVGPRPAVELLWAIEPAALPPGATTDVAPGGGGAPSSRPTPSPPAPLRAPTEGWSGEGTADSSGESPHPSPLPEGVGTSRAERMRRREADFIARRLRGLLDSGEKIVWEAGADGEAARAVCPGDIAILFRALTDVAYYEEALRRWDIDYYLVGGHAFYAQQEIYDVVNLLRSLVNPADEVSLAGVLRSPMFALLDETLFWLARGGKGLSAGLFAEELPAELDAEQARRAAAAAATLSALRAMKDRLPIAGLLQEALARTGYDAVLLAEFLGERKLANLRKLVDQARSFDQSGLLALDDFITELSQFIVRQPDEPLAATQPETVDVVRLMSVHQAKGLEFPVVVVADLDRPRRGPTERAAFTRQLGPMIKDSRAKAASGYDLFRLSEHDQEEAELVRLLYVATTRAADYLILSSGLPEAGSAKGPWTELLGRHFDLLTGAAREAEGDSPIFAARKSGQSPGALVKVTSQEPPVGRRAALPATRQNLDGLIEKARQMAAGHEGQTPKYLAAVPPETAGRREYSFSRLRGSLHARTAVTPPAGDEEEEPRGPPPLDPLGLGTLVHAVLAEIDLARPEEMAGLVRRHAPRHLAATAGGDDGRLDEPMAWITRLLASPRGAALATAAESYRELEFLLAWPPGRPDPAGTCLQGFIDCLYRDASGGWHVIDYKTNRVAAGQLAAAAADYEMQMLVYGMAVEGILGRGPQELALCFLRPGLEYRFPWDAAARQRALVLVDEAMARLCGGGT